MTSVSNFTDLQIDSSLLPKLAHMKISQPTAIQSQAIPTILSGQDCIGLAETGSGKTLTYILSLETFLLKNPKGRALILSPTKETADQVHRVYSQFRENVCLVSATIQNSIIEKQLRKNPKVIVATPGRLFDHLKNNKLLLQGLNLLVIDEADRMMELGFDSQLQFIHSTLRGERQTLMFGATFNEKASKVSQLFLKPDHQKIQTENLGVPVQSLDQTVYFLQVGQKQNRLLDDLRKIKGPMIIFTESQESCVSVGRLLGHKELSCDFVHGDMNPGHRNRVLREFRENRFQILITTDLLARGLDVPEVECVLNYDLPYKAEDFLHRIGRTARAGRSGKAITYISPKDGRTYRKIKTYLAGATEEQLSDQFQFVD